VIEYNHHQDDDSKKKSTCQEEVLPVKENQSVRNAARSAGIPLWKVAAAIGVSEPTLTRWLRFPLPKDKEQRVMAAISELSREVV